MTREQAEQVLAWLEAEVREMKDYLAAPQPEQTSNAQQTVLSQAREAIRRRFVETHYGADVKTGLSMAMDILDHLIDTAGQSELSPKEQVTLAAMIEYARTGEAPQPEPAQPQTTGDNGQIVNDSLTRWTQRQFEKAAVAPEPGWEDAGVWADEAERLAANLNGPYTTDEVATSQMTRATAAAILSDGAALVRRLAARLREEMK